MAYQKTCQICSKAFESESRNTRYCCEACAARGAKKAHRRRKLKAIRSEGYASEKEINQLIQRAYTLSRDIAKMFIPQECSCTDSDHVCEGELECHHIDHNPLNMAPSNLRWLCKKAHAELHSKEEDCDFMGELKAYKLIKEQADIRTRNKSKRENKDN